MKFVLRNSTKTFWLALVALLFSGVTSYAANNVTLKASAPNSVAMGAMFEVTYVVNSFEASNFRGPSFEGFDVKYGPSQFTKSAMEIINGKTTKSESITYTYSVMPTKEGIFQIGSASVSVKGKSYTSDKLTIKVLPADKTANSHSNGAKSGSGKSASNSDIFVLAQLSKNNIYEQEATVLTYKLYVSSVSLVGGRMIKVPDFKGTHAQDLANINERWELEHYNGRNYRTTILKQVVLFPQQSGKIEIDPLIFEAEIEQNVEFEDPFDAFFNTSRSSRFKQNISSKPITIDVKALPAGKPLNYSGGVGKFSLTSSVSNTEVKANEAVTVKLVISGTGNMKLMSTPVVEFPSDFEVYDPKVEDHFRLTSEGETGNRVIEYLVIPRHDGNYKIDPIKFSYFDIASSRYRELSTEPINLKVEKSANGSTSTSTAISNYTNKEDLKILNEDIRYIKLNKVTLKPQPSFIQGSLTYRLYFIVMALLFIGFIVFNAKQAKLNSNTALVRTKKANKMARNRMKSAYKLMISNNKGEFYDEVLRALWGYIGDKLNIPVSKLTKDNIDQELTKYGVEEPLRKDLLSVLNDCEFAKFAPGDDSLAMDKILARATELIGNLDGVIKNKKN